MSIRWGQNRGEKIHKEDKGGDQGADADRRPMSVWVDHPRKGWKKDAGEKEDDVHDELPSDGDDAEQEVQRRAPT